MEDESKNSTQEYKDPETTQEYFSIISQFKEHIEEIEDTIDEDELRMTSLNGLTRPWDAFI